MKKMRLAITCRAVGIGGAERKAQIFFDEISKHTFVEPFLIRVGKREAKEKNVINTTPEKLTTVLEELNLDVVYTIWEYDRVIKWAKTRKSPKVLLHVNFTVGYRKGVPNLIISKTDYYKIKLWKGGMQKDDYVVYNPQQIELWKPKPKPKTSKVLTIGRIGRAEPSKWSFRHLSTLFLLNFRKERKRLRFSFAGMPRLYRWVIALTIRPDIKRTITYYPEMKDKDKINKWYQSIDVFWQSALVGESFGNVLTEAALSGVPTVTDYMEFKKRNGVHLWKYNAQAEVIDHGTTGWYASYPSTVIKTFDSIDNQEAYKRGKAGRKKVITHYDAKVSAETLLAIAQQVTSWPGKRLQIRPSKKECEDQDKTYAQYTKLHNEVEKDTSTIEKALYWAGNGVWRVIETSYVAIRKLLRKINIDLEKGIAH